MSIKIETTFEFIESDCDVEKLLSDWLMFVLYYVWFYSMTFTLNNDSLTNKMVCVGKKQVIEMFQTGFTYQQVSDELKERCPRKKRIFCTFHQILLQ